MIQNIMALTIVFSAAAFTIFSIIKSLTAKESSHCGGCSACNLKQLPLAEKSKITQYNDFKNKKITPLKH